MLTVKYNIVDYTNRLRNRQGKKPKQPEHNKDNKTVITQKEKLSDVRAVIQDKIMKPGMNRNTDPRIRSRM